jgi:hypothetical protein
MSPTRYKIVTVATTNIVLLTEAELKSLLVSKGLVKIIIDDELHNKRTTKYIQIAHVVEIVDLDNQVTKPIRGRG